MSSEEDYYYDDDDGSFGGDEPADSDADDVDVEDIGLEKEAEYAVLSRDELVKKQQSEIQQVCGVLEVGAPFARILLTHWKWNMEALLAKFLEKGKSYVYKESGITEGDQQVLTSMFTCPSCYDEYKGEETTALSCGHRFCNDCWKTYITMKIKDGESTNVKCMGSKCSNLFDESLIASFVDSSTLNKYNRFLVESYVVDSTRKKWCPSTPHCGNAIEVHYGTAVDVKCKCGTPFCFKCLGSPHPPCTCEMMGKWAVKCRDDSETSNWLFSNTKACPKCGKVIEKDGGCNLVTCKCGQHFCWLCGEGTGAAHTWSSISGHTCGKYKDNESDVARRNLQRYKTHQDSLDKEMKLGTKEAIEATMEGLRKCSTRSYGASEISWIAKATEQLFNARRVLGNSYVFAFYVFGEDFVPDPDDEKLNALRKNPIPTAPKNPTREFLKSKKKSSSSAKKNLFEDHQEQLEFTTERLSSFLETSVASMDNDILQNIANYAGLAEKRCKGLQDVIQNEFLGGDSSTTSKSSKQEPIKSTTQTTQATQAIPPKHVQQRNHGNRRVHPPVVQVPLPAPFPPPVVINDKPKVVSPKPRPVVQQEKLKHKKEQEQSGDEDDDGNRKKRKAWGLEAGYDEEAALLEAIKNSQATFSNSKPNSKNNDNNNNNNNSNDNSNDSNNSARNPINVDDEDEDLKEALRRSMLDSSTEKLPTKQAQQEQPQQQQQQQQPQYAVDEDADLRMALELSMKYQ